MQCESRGSEESDGVVTECWLGRRVCKLAVGWDECVCGIFVIDLSGEHDGVGPIDESPCLMIIKKFSNRHMLSALQFSQSRSSACSCGETWSRLRWLILLDHVADEYGDDAFSHSCSRQSFGRRQKVPFSDSLKAEFVHPTHFPQSSNVHTLTSPSSPVLTITSSCSLRLPLSNRGAQTA